MARPTADFICLKISCGGFGGRKPPVPRPHEARRMTLWTAKDAAAATQGRTTAGWSASGVSIDTRTLQRAISSSR